METEQTVVLVEFSDIPEELAETFEVVRVSVADIPEELAARFDNGVTAAEFGAEYEGTPINEVVKFIRLRDAGGGCVQHTMYRSVRSAIIGQHPNWIRIRDLNSLLRDSVAALGGAYDELFIQAIANAQERHQGE